MKNAGDISSSGGAHAPSRAAGRAPRPAAQVSVSLNVSALAKTRVAVVGSGFGLYGVLPAFQQIPACAVVGLCGRSSERLLNYCQKTAVPVFHDWRAMLEQCRPDALAVAVVPSRQHEILSCAIARGISVFAEKPLAVNPAQAAALLEQARAKKAAHMVDFLFPEIPQWRRAGELLAQGAIGRVLHCQMNWRFLGYEIKNKIQGWRTRPEEGGGALSFYFCHVFYSLEFFLGKMQSLRCGLVHTPDAPGAGETGVSLAAEFQNGCAGNVIFDCAFPGAHEHAWEFHGEAGSLILEKTSASFTRGFELTRRPKNGPAEKVSVPPLPCDPSLYENVPLVRSLAGRFLHWQRDSVPARPDFADGLRVQHLIELARQSSHLKKSLLC
jgi:predicted dehydrogenase